MQHIHLWQHMATHESIKLPLAKVSPTWLQLYYHPLMWPPMSIASKQVRARLGLAAKGLPCRAKRAGHALSADELDQKWVENSQEIGPIHFPGKLFFSWKNGWEKWVKVVMNWFTREKLYQKVFPRTNPTNPN